MFVVLTYDIEQKRVQKVMKIVKKYLHPVHRSVFDGYLTEGQIKSLKKELHPIIDPENDSIILYKYVFSMGVVKDELGIVRQGREFL